MLAHEIEKDNATQSITVMLDQTADNILKDFHCPCCGRTVFKYYGGIKLLVPGETDVDWIEIVGKPKPIQCKNKRQVTLNTGRTVATRCKTVLFIIG